MFKDSVSHKQNLWTRNQ